MALARLLIANRGEIALRILRSAAELGIRTVAVYGEDDADALHVLQADAAVPLPGRGAAAYLDVAAVVGAARAAGCDALHPGYGFLSERAELAHRCAEAGIVFVGPRAETLARLGDKAVARAIAQRCGVPVLPGTSGPTTLEQARDFLASLGPGAAVMVKAIAGGGGRGMRMVRDPGALDAAFARCRSEAQAAFGVPDVYVEQVLAQARHVEVQVLGDGSGAAAHLGDRDCSLQRRHQKLVEVAPAPGLEPPLREALASAAVRLAAEVQYLGVGTVEFLVEGGRFAFIEANARLQVEHPVTEAVTGVDLVAIQLALAGGASLAALGLDQARVPRPRGAAVELRVNLERLDPDGSVRPAAGTVAELDLPAGPGVRVDTAAHRGYRAHPGFDPLLAKVIVSTAADDVATLMAKAYRALCELRVEGVETNLPLLRALVGHPALAGYDVHTRFLDETLPALLSIADDAHPRRVPPPPAAGVARPGLAGAKVDPRDPLAVLMHGKTAAPDARVVAEPPVADGVVAVRAPMQGTVVAIDVSPGDAVPAGAQLLVMEAMKMEHVVSAATSGVLREVRVHPGDTVYEGHVLALLEAGEVDASLGGEQAAMDLDRVRPDLREVLDRHAVTHDAARPEAVARRRGTGQRTARENVDDLCDPATFVEYGALAIAAQRRRRSVEELITRTPADGLVAGVGRVNGALFEESRTRCAVLAYDYTVLAGTQGLQNHRKKDRLFELAAQWRLPVVFFTEGGGGRPGDTDGVGIAGLDCWAFNYWARLSGLVPLVGINSGRCFAGNAALLGCCDVVIATANSSIGMGGPAMIEGGGLGVFRPEEVGPMHVQVPNGVVDVAVDDEAEAVRVAKQYLGYFQGPLRDWTCADQRLLRGLVPENRLRVYDVRAVIRTLADTGSVLELRRHFGLGMVTALARVEGRPLGVVANDPGHLGGAIDSDGADKAARFMQLCDAFDLPLLMLCDTPGMMVGPEVEKTALVRHCSRLFLTGANLSVPVCTIVLRKGYGLGAQAMAAGSFKAPLFTVAWPTGEFGGMGLEGAVKLGFRNELAAVEDPAARAALFQEMVARMYEHGKAVNYATYFEIDDVIDPADSRHRLASALRAVPAPPPRTGKRRPCVDAW